ncbi:MAG: hypothetical protein ACH255_07595 [Candidatus Thiodiazotropha sp.]
MSGLSDIPAHLNVALSVFKLVENQGYAPVSRAIDVQQALSCLF